MTKKNERISVGARVTIYRRGAKGIFTADFFQAGKHRRQSLKTTNLKIALQKAAKIDTQLASGESLASPPPTTIADAVALFIAWKRTERKRPRSIQKYKGFLETFTAFAERRAACRLRQVTPDLVDEFRAVRKLAHSARSMHNEAVMLKAFFRWCKSRGKMLSNPMEDMYFKRPPVTPRGGPTVIQIDQILAAASESRRTQLAVLALSGMRAGELRNLQVQDIDLQSNWIEIVSREGAETKTGLSRKVPVHPRLRAMLLALPQRSSGWLFTAAPSKKFPKGGHFINTKRLNEDLLELLDKLDMPRGRHCGFTVHSLRHSFKASAVNAGVPERAVDVWLGHSAGNSVRALYYLLSDEESQRFMKKVPFGTGEPAAGTGD